MNIDNLKAIARYISGVPQRYFDMTTYRKVNEQGVVVGCILGHCSLIDNNLSLYLDEDGDTDFIMWARNFTGISPSSDEWKYLFGQPWINTDNTTTGASKRILYFLEHGLPITWKDEMNGKTKLSY